MRFGATCLVLALGCLGCGSRRPAAVRMDPALATLVPADTVLLVGVRMDKLRATPLYRKLGAPMLPVSAGIDLEKAWELLAVSDGERTAVLARGDFADRGMEPRVDLPGGMRTQYKGYRITANEILAITFVNPTTAITGQPEAVRAILNARGQSSGPSAELQALVDSIPPENQIWVAGAGAARLARQVPKNGNLANLGTALRLVDHLTAGAVVETGAHLTIKAICRSPQDADSLAGALRVFVGLARLNTAGPLKIDQQEKAVNIDATLPPEFFDRLAK